MNHGTFERKHAHRSIGTTSNHVDEDLAHFQRRQGKRFEGARKLLADVDNAAVQSRLVMNERTSGGLRSRDMPGGEGLRAMKIPLDWTQLHVGERIPRERRDSPVDGAGREEQRH
jgi:hypothetical protein